MAVNAVATILFVATPVAMGLTARQQRRAERMASIGLDQESG